MAARKYLLQDSSPDRILRMVVMLASEVWTLRERLAALEVLGVRDGALRANALDAFEFTPEQETRLALERKEFMESLFRILQERGGSAPPRKRARTQIKKSTKRRK